MVLTSRAIDCIEETRLVPERKIRYQFSARGHDVAQVLLGSLLDHPRDAANGYYRSRPLLLALGLCDRRILVCADHRDDVTLTIDHRVLDAYQTNKYLTLFVKRLENSPD